MTSGTGGLRTYAAPGRWWLVPLLGAALTLGYVGYLTYAAPRPYFVTDIDAEQDYYYNARLIASGLPGSVHHPGTPAYYLAFLLLRVHGDSLEAAQGYFNGAYLVIGLLAAAALLLFGALALRGAPPWVAGLSVASVLAWPPFLSYLNILGADAFIVPVGLPAVGLFWASLQGNQMPARRLLFWGGAAIGLSLAVKMSFLPLAIALCAGYGVRVLRAQSGRPGTASSRVGPVAWLRAIAPLALGAAATYVLAVSPVLRRVAVIWQGTLTRPDTAPADGGILGAFAKTGALLADHAPLWLLLVAGATGGVVLGVAGRIRADRRSSRPTRSMPAAVDEMDLVAAGVALGLLGAAFVYTGAAAVPISPGSEPGIRLRNMSPTVLGAPLLVLYAWRLLGAAPARASLRSLLPGAAAVLAAATVAAALMRHGSARAEFIRAHLERIDATTARLERLGGPTGRIAFWTESAQDYLGAASFHFWGNYRYANHAYDQELLDRFPRHTFLRLRSIGRSEQLGASPPQEGRSRHGRLGDLYWTVRRTVLSDREHYSRSGGLVVGAEQAVPVSVVAFPEIAVEEPAGMNRKALLGLLERQLGVGPPRRETIGGMPWLVLSGQGVAVTTSSTVPPAQPAGQGGR